MNDLSAFLEGWFARHCDGDWEHGQGVRIITLDNPGWSVEIDLAGTDLAARPFSRVEDERGEDDWVHCWTESESFKGRGGPGNLREILAIFANWSEGYAE